MDKSLKLSKIKLNLDKELDRLSSAIEKLENDIDEIQKGADGVSLWNGELAYTSIKDVLIQIETYKKLLDNLYECSNYLSFLESDSNI